MVIGHIMRTCHLSHHCHLLSRLFWLFITTCFFALVSDKLYLLDAFILLKYTIVFVKVVIQWICPLVVGYVSYCLSSVSIYICVKTFTTGHVIYSNNVWPELLFPLLCPCIAARGRVSFKYIIFDLFFKNVKHGQHFRNIFMYTFRKSLINKG